MSPGLLPYGPTSLDGTLTADQVLTQSQALAQAEQERIARQAQEASQAAGQAGQQYQQATQQPSPTLNPADVFIPTLLSHIASTIAQDPSYVTRAHEGIKSEQEQLLKNRMQNLQALRDLYGQKADAAEKLGNLQATEGFRTKMSQMDKTLELLKQREHDAAAERAAKAAADRELNMENYRQKNRLDLKRAPGTPDEGSAAAGADLYFPSLVTTTGGGNQFLDLTSVTAKERPAAMQWAQKNGLVAVAANGVDHLRRIQTARDNITAMLAQAQSILPGDPSQRISQYGNRKMSRILQTSEERAAWGTWRISAIEQLTALAGGMGSGLRINKSEIEQAIQNDIPTLNDTYSTALRKANNLRMMLDHTERPLINRDWTGTASGEKPSTETPQAQSQAMVKMRSPKGVLMNVPADQVKDSVAHGYTRVK